MVSTLLPRRGARRIPALRRAQLPAEVQRKTLRPLGANTPAAVRVPRSVGAEKKAAARTGRTRLRQFAYPAQPVQRKRLPPGQGEPADAVRVPPSNHCQKTQKPPYEPYGGFFYVLSRLLGDNKHRNVPNKLIQQDIHHRKRVCGILVQQVEHDQHTEQAGERAERQRRADGAR